MTKVSNTIVEYFQPILCYSKSFITIILLLKNILWMRNQNYSPKRVQIKNVPCAALSVLNLDKVKEGTND